MATAKARKPSRKADRESAVGTTVVVVARCASDDLPVRVFAGDTPRHDAVQWVTRLARSKDAADETVRTLADRIGWELASYGVMFFSIVVHVGGVPTEKLGDVFVGQTVEAM
jgi:hypothetical protein